MKSSILTMLFLILLVSGCASVETVKEAQGQGSSRVYQYAYDRVYNATLSAAKAKELEVLENDKPNGRLVLSHGVTLWSWGERIAVFFTATMPRSTKVEIVSKPVMSPLNFPPDWQQILLDQIDVELQSKR